MTNMDIHQLNLSYLPVDDRLLLRVNTRQGTEFSIWLTRKFTLGLWNALQSCAQSHAVQAYAGKADVSDPTLRRELTEFSSSKHLQQADFTTPYSAPAQGAGAVPNYAQRGAAQAPFLPTSLAMEARANGQTQLTLKDENRQMTMMLDERLLHALMQLIAQTVAQADWGVTLQNTDTAKSSTVLN